MMVSGFVFIGFVIGCIVSGSVFLYVCKKSKGLVVPMKKDKIDITVQDIIRLTALRTTLDIHSLVVEYKIHVRHPEFYEKYQALNKHERELYFDELVTIFSKEHPEDVCKWYERYPALTTQDVLLLLMIEMKLDNRTMARIMMATMEALKKRKTRLKAKIGADFPIIKADTDV